MKTNKEILAIAMQQSAIDSNCKPEDFIKKDNIVVTSEKNENARRYLKLPYHCNLVSYGTNVVASTKQEYKEFVRDYINSYEVSHCMETPNLYILDQKFCSLGLRVCFMAEYFLPDVTILKELPCNYELKVLSQPDFKDLYKEEWSNALCETRKELDVIGVGAYDGSRLIGLAGASADCDTMWQIGVDVLPEYRKQGIASAMTSKLALEILKKDIVPFYCCAWCNIKSARNAVKSGFRPAWADLTVMSQEYVDKQNQRKEL